MWINIFKNILTDRKKTRNITSRRDQMSSETLILVFLSIGLASYFLWSVNQEENNRQRFKEVWGFEPKPQDPHSRQIVQERLELGVTKLEALVLGNASEQEKDDLERQLWLKRYVARQVGYPV